MHDTKSPISHERCKSRVINFDEEGDGADAEVY